MRWNSAQYERFADERSQPFFDLMSRVGAVSPRRVVDLGCGSGELTAALARRWPEADVLGLDSSEAMIARGAGVEQPNLRVVRADLSAWRPAADTDVVVSNAALQWVDTHRQLLRDWAAALPRGAWLAWQVPGNFTAPSHALMREVAQSPRWAPQLAGRLRPADATDSPAAYATLLLESGWTATAWETTYLHLLAGPDPVLEWVRGTALRPVLDALDADEAAEFEADYAARLRFAYPATAHGTFLPFRRVFCVGHKA